MWPQIIKALKTKGYSQYDLAARTGIDQSTICRLGDGRSREPRYSVGKALIELAGGADALSREHGIQVGTFVLSESSSPPTSIDGEQGHA